MNVSIELPLEPSSAGAARGVLRSFAPCMPERRLGELQLMATELVTSCVRHRGTRGFVTFSARLDESFARVEVDFPTGATDPASGPIVPSERLGLWIVDLLAREWGVQQGGERTTVWAEIDTASIRGGT